MLLPISLPLRAFFIGASQPCSHICLFLAGSQLPLLHGVAPLPLLPYQEILGEGAFRAPQPEGNAHPVQGRAVVPGRGRARPLVHPHRLAPPPGCPQAQALKKLSNGVYVVPIYYVGCR